MSSGRTIAIAGAGSIGCFVGGMLAAGGRRVALLARPRVIGEIEANGLRPTSFEGFDQTIAANQFALSENPSILAMPPWCWWRSRAPIPPRWPKSLRGTRRQMS